MMRFQRCLRSRVSVKVRGGSGLNGLHSTRFCHFFSKSVAAEHRSLNCPGKHATTLVATDSDHDGLEDRLEQALLLQFAPTFMVAEHDCSNLPARFEMGVKEPVGTVENGTVYGQVFPLRGTAEQGLRAEIHYYHLWRKDCGGHGHPLDTEHVAVLVLGSGRNLGAATWKQFTGMRLRMRTRCAT